MAMCYAYSGSRQTVGSALGFGHGGMGADPGGNDAFKATQATYVAAKTAWANGGMVGPPPVNPNAVMWNAAIASNQANRRGNIGKVGAAVSGTR